MFKLIKLLKPKTGIIIVAGIFLLINTICTLALPTLMNYIITNGIRAYNFTLIWKLCLVMFAFTAVSAISAIISTRIICKVTCWYTALLRSKTFDHVNNIPLSEINRIGKGALLTRCTHDIWTCQEFLDMTIRAMFVVPLMIIGGAILAFMSNWLLALIILVSAPFLIFICVLMSKRVMPLYKTSNEYIDRQNTIVRERLTGIRVVRAFDREEFEHNRMADATITMANHIIRANVYMNILAPVGLFIMNCVTVTILALSTSLITAAAMTVGEMVAILQYVSLIMSAIFNAAFAIILYPMFKVSMERIAEIFSCERIRRNSQPITVSGDIFASSVAYRYPDADADALKPLDFSIKAGQKVAFIGGTGSGKSTLINMLTGLTSNTSGSLKIGGQELSTLTVDDMAKNVTTVFQKSDIFSGTLRENVDPLATHTDEEIIAAFNDAQFGDFVAEHGLDYKINQNGSNLSGGQKQRLAITRAFLKPASIYLFDDSFSALDYLTEKRLRQRMASVLKGATIIIATQRVSAAHNCDNIFVFDAGKLVGSGKHDMLMNSCEIYKQIYLSQTGGKL